MSQNPANLPALLQSCVSLSAPLPKKRDKQAPVLVVFA